MCARQEPHQQPYQSWCGSFNKLARVSKCSPEFSDLSSKLEDPKEGIMQSPIYSCFMRNIGKLPGLEAGF